MTSKKLQVYPWFYEDIKSQQSENKETNNLKNITPKIEKIFKEYSIKFKKVLAPKYDSRDVIRYSLTFPTKRKGIFWKKVPINFLSQITKRIGEGFNIDPTTNNASEVYQVIDLNPGEYVHENRGIIIEIIQDEFLEFMKKSGRKNKNGYPLVNGEYAPSLLLPKNSKSQIRAEKITSRITKIIDREYNKQFSQMYN